MIHIKQDLSLKAWVRACWVDLGGGAQVKIKLFRIWSCCISIKADDAGSNMVANILPTDTPLTQGVGSKGQTISFSESSHVAYQIKADDPGSNMVANILSTDTPLTQGVGSKSQTISFSESSHVSSKADDAGSKYFAHRHTLDPGGGVKLYLFLKVVMLHIKLKGIEHRAP